MNCRPAARCLASVLTLLLVARGSALAQIQSSPSENGLNFALDFGVAHTRSGTVSDRTFDALRKWSPDLGATAYFAHHGFFIGPEVAWVSPSPYLTGGASRLHAGDLMVDAGRIFRISYPVAIYPLLGLGWGWNDASNDNPPDVTPRGAPGSFDAAISQPSTSKSFHRNTVITTVGAGAQYNFVLREDGFGGEHDLFIGFRSGIRLSHDLGNWTQGGQSLPGGPATALAGPFFQLSLGLALWSRPNYGGFSCPTC